MFIRKVSVFLHATFHTQDRCKTLRNELRFNIKKERIGWAKQIVGFSSLFVMNPYSIIYGLPIYLIGLYLLWKSELTKKNKLQWTFLPLLVSGMIYLIIYFLDQ